MKMFLQSWSTAFVCLISCMSFIGAATVSPTQANPRVLIVGAGSAGIAAASRLYQNGIKNVTILEASQRFGGRIRSTPFGSGVVELGAQWCHGEKDNVLYEMASIYPDLLKSSVVADDAVLVRSNGVQVPVETAERLMELAESIMASPEKGSYAGSLGDFFSEKYWQILRNDSAYRDVARDLADQFLVLYHDYQRGYNAYDSWYEVAANETDSYVVSEGNQVLAWMGSKGFSTILDIITGNFPGAINSTEPVVPLENLITYGKFVSNIQWSGNPTEHVLITTEDGALYQADHVIVTVSLGVLKENYRTMFTPALPTVNEQAINGLYFGTVNKIFILFDAPIPEHFPAATQLLWFEEDLQALRNSTHAWAESITAFYRVDKQSHVLAAWMNGAKGEQLPDPTVVEGVQHLLSIFAKDVQFGRVQQVLRSSWSTDRYFRGSYSSRSMTTEQLKTGAKYLATPLITDVGKPVVLFAGEATNRKRYSTVHGAVESGFREADRLLKLLSSEIQ